MDGESWGTWNDVHRSCCGIKHKRHSRYIILLYVYMIICRYKYIYRERERSVHTQNKKKSKNHTDKWLHTHLKISCTVPSCSDSLKNISYLKVMSDVQGE